MTWARCGNSWITQRCTGCVTLQSLSCHRAIFQCQLPSVSGSTICTLGLHSWLFSSFGPTVLGPTLATILLVVILINYGTLRKMGIMLGQYVRHPVALIAQQLSSVAKPFGFDPVVSFQPVPAGSYDVIRRKHHSLLVHYGFSK